MRTIQLAALAAITILPTQAAWVEWSTVVPTNQVNGTFNGGTIVATRTNVNAGIASGSPGLAPNSISTLITPSFASLYPLNAGGVLPMLGASYNDSSESFDGQINFTGLGNGYMPTGTIFGLLDIDSRENLNNMRAFDASGNLITSAWLTQRSGLLGFLDASLLDGIDSVASLNPVPYSFTGNAYNFIGPAANDSAGALMFLTNQDISLITYSTEHRLPGNVGGGGYNFAIGSDVPEPSTYAMFSVGLLAAAYLKRRQNTL
jgi:hypothetical protein